MAHGFILEHLGVLIRKGISSFIDLAKISYEASDPTLIWSTRIARTLYKFRIVLDVAYTSIAE